MGIFDFLKKNGNAEQVTTNNGLLGPTYFEGLTEQIVNPKNLKPYEWRRKLVSKSGNSKFRIKYYGELHNRTDSLIIATDFAPSLIYAQDISNSQDILLFDGCKFGYNAMFCDEYSFEQISKRPTDKLVVDKDGNDLFEIILSAYYQIKFDDEQEDFLNEVDENGYIQLADKTKISFEHAKRNAFDVFQITAISSSGKSREIVSEELS